MQLSTDSSPSTGLADAVRSRRTVRVYDGRPIDTERLLTLLRAGQGITDAEGKRAAPSAHALYPLTLFVAAGRVEGHSAGLHRYDPAGDGLADLAPGDLRAGLCAAALEDQPWVAQAAAVIVIGADLDRAVAAFVEQPPDGRRGIRYVYLEAGAVVQTICLQATELGLGTVFVGGFDDAKTAAVLDLPRPFEPVGLICVGWPGS